MLATVTLLDRSIAAEVNDALPARAPSFFFVDIQPDQMAAFDKTIASFHSQSDYQRTPMIRGRITALNGVPSADAKISSDAKWVLNGDRGITYSATPPPGTNITKGEWWPANYSGPTLISLDQDIAKGTGLKIGDSITLNVLGREITGRIANLRKVDFTTGGQNFVLVLSPGLIDKAPHSFLATVRVDGGDENAMYNAHHRPISQHLDRAGEGRHRPGGHAAAATGDRASAPPAWSPSWRGCWCWRAPSRRARAPGFMTPRC